MLGLELSVSQFVALVNQTLEFAYPSVNVTGELANFRVSKSKWVYFDLKDEEAIVRCFGSVYQLPGPLEDGMLLKVRSVPRLHPQYGFSLNVIQITPSGEGAIKKAASLLEAKLRAEGLFAPERKRPLPYPPASIGLITSVEAAAYGDFIKIIGQRWPALEVTVGDVQVQGEAAPEQIVQMLERLNQQSKPPEVLVLTRGGGSSDDLAAFSNESVVRALAASRIPTLVAVGHESDISLAELVADQRASTPSNAAELLAPDRSYILERLEQDTQQLAQITDAKIQEAQSDVAEGKDTLKAGLGETFSQAWEQLIAQRQLLKVLSPQAALSRGFSLVYKNDQLISRTRELSKDDIVKIKFSEGQVKAGIIKLEN